MSEIAILEPGALVVKNIMDVAQASNMIIPPAWRGIVGRAAKELYNEGYELDMITAACWMAVLRGRPQLAQSIAGDLMLATTGMKMSRAEYETKLALYAADKKPSMLDEYRRSHDA